MTQVTRVIRINTSNTTTKIALDTAATTWGELKEEMMAHPVAKLALDGNVKAVVRETRVTLDDDAAQLPAFDCQLFMTVKKSKGGALNDEYTSMGIKELDKACKSKGIKPGSTVGNSRVKLRAYDKKNGTVAKSTKKEVAKKPASSKNVTAKKVAAKETVAKETVAKVDPEVKAKMDKKAKKAAKKAKKLAKKEAIEETVVPSCPVLSAVNEGISNLDAIGDKQDPENVAGAALSSLMMVEGDLAESISALVANVAKAVRTYEFADKAEVKEVLSKQSK